MRQNPKEALALRVVDTWLDYQSRFTDLPGFQVCLRKKGQIVFSKAYGVANLTTQRPLKTTDFFHIASHSKTFTSCAILQLVEQGKLALHHFILDYLPELKKHKDKRFKKITIRDLLSNRSGIFRDGLDCEFWNLQKPFPSREQLIQEVLASDLIFGPNEQTKYSNMAYSLLGLILENVLGMSYQKAMESLVFKKLKGVKLLTDYEEAHRDRFAEGHSRTLWEGKRLTFEHAPARGLASATGFCGNAEDTSLFFDTFLCGKGLVTKETQQEILALNWAVKNEPETRYGLGLVFDHFSDMDLVGHKGGYPGFSTYTAHWMGTEYVISVLVNANEYLPVRIARSLLQILQKIKTTFMKEEAETALLGGPFMDKWGTSLCVLTKKKGLCFMIDTWAPCGSVSVLTSKDGEAYMCDTQSGFYSPGEKITFAKDKDGTLLSMKWSGSLSPLEDGFREDLQAMVLA